jgi:hypothetical protein
MSLYVPLLAGILALDSHLCGVPEAEWLRMQ